MLCHTGAEDARTESGEQNAQDMDHAVASVPRALRIREDVGRVTRDAILAAQATLAASSTMTASKPTNSQSTAAKPVTDRTSVVEGKMESVLGELSGSRVM